MKKAIALALCLVLALSLCVPACAEYTVEDFVAELQAEELGYDYYEVRYENDIVYVYVSMDGMAEEAGAAKEDENLDNWNKVTAKMDELSISLQERANEEFEDLPTCVYVFNDLDSTKLIYITSNGECLYDWVTYTVEDYVKEVQEDESDWDYYEVELVDDTICYYVALDGLAEAAVEANESQDFDAWNRIMEEMDEMAAKAQEEAAAYFPEISTELFLLNDTNTDTMLYMARNGECVYDWASGYDIRGEENAALPQDGLEDDGKIHVYLTGEGERIETPESSWIDALTYYAENEHLILETNGKEYAYANVSQELWKEFKNADSKGTFYNRTFKGAEEYWVNDYDGSNSDLIIIEHVG